MIFVLYYAKYLTNLLKKNFIFFIDNKETRFAVRFFLRLRLSCSRKSGFTINISKLLRQFKSEFETAREMQKSESPRNI